MGLARLLDRIRFYMAVVGFGWGAGIFWGALAAVVAKLAFGIDEIDAWLFVGLPVAVIFTAWIWKKLPRLLGLEE
jgi:branched-subunit amino acid ABC-type transport system permease component